MYSLSPVLRFSCSLRRRRFCVGSKCRFGVWVKWRNPIGWRGVGRTTEAKPQGECARRHFNRAVARFVTNSTFVFRGGAASRRYGYYCCTEEESLFRFLDDKTSVLHNEIKYTTKFSPINWGYSSGTGNTGYWQHSPPVHKSTLISTNQICENERRP